MHYEPGFPAQENVNAFNNHADWLWRIANHNGLKKQAFYNNHELIYIINAFEDNAIDIAENYILFSKDPNKTIIVSNPRIIARHGNGHNNHETWEEDEFSKQIKLITLDIINPNQIIIDG